MLISLICLTVLTGQMSPHPLYRFVAFGDGRGSSAVDTDMTIQKEVIKGMLDANPAFILQSGDLVYDSSIQALWDQFDQTMQPVWKSHIPYYPAEGNHDNVGTSLYPGYLKKRIMPTWKPGRKSDVPERYSIDEPPLRFIAINTEESTEPGSIQYKWIEKELQDATVKKLKCVPFFHITIHSIGDHGTDKVKQAQLEPLFMGYHVPLVLMGHDHIYYRTKRHGIIYVTTGGGGAPLYDLHAGRDPRAADDPEDPNYPDVSQKLYHYCVCDVFPDHVEVVVRAGHYDGPNPIDQFSVPLG